MIWRSCVCSIAIEFCNHHTIVKCKERFKGGNLGSDSCIYYDYLGLWFVTIPEVIRPRCYVLSFSSTSALKLFSKEWLWAFTAGITLARCYHILKLQQFMLHIQ